MKLKKHGAVLIQYVIDFADGKISRSDFDRDYSGCCIEHFPYFEVEHPRLAARFAETVDKTYDFCSGMDDNGFRDAIAYALDAFFHPNIDLI